MTEDRSAEIAFDFGDSRLVWTLPDAVVGVAADAASLETAVAALVAALSPIVNNFELAITHITLKLLCGLNEAKSDLSELNEFLQPFVLKLEDRAAVNSASFKLLQQLDTPEE